VDADEEELLLLLELLLEECDELELEELAHAVCRQGSKYSLPIRQAPLSQWN